MIDQLVSEGHPLKSICQVLQISRSSYYRRRQVIKKSVLEERRKQKCEVVLKHIIQIKSEHPFWGYRRVRAYLQYRMDIKTSRKYIYRLMKDNALLVDIKRYKATRTPQRDKPRAEKQNQIWGTDMTKFYVDTVGWLYLVIVLDWYTKKLVGWNISLRSKAEQWIEVLTQGVEKELTEGSRQYELMLVSDNGSQPTSIKYGSYCNLLGIKHITTSYSNPKGNAETERFFRTFKEEVLWVNDFNKVEEAISAVETFINFYNNDYPHSALGYISPVDIIKQQNYLSVA